MSNTITTKNSIAIIVRTAQKGGIENHVYDLLHEIIRRGYNPVLICLANDHVDSNFKKLGISIISLEDSLLGGIISLTNIYRLYKELKKIKVNVVHSHGTRPIFIGTVAAKLAGVQKVVVTVHNSYRLMAFNSANKINPFKLIVSLVMHAGGLILADNVIFISKRLRDEFYTAYKYFLNFNTLLRRKVSIIHNWAAYEFYSKPVEISPKKTTVIGQVGRLDPNKCTKNLIHAVKQLVDLNYRIELLIVGDGYLKKELINLTKELELSDIVHFKGHQEHVLKYYNAMDMLVIASNSEGLSLVMLEAMLSGLPVVATDVGAAREVITDKESGIIVPPNDVNALKEGIQYLLDHENERMKIIRKGQKVVQSKFDKQSSLNSMLNFYELS